MSNYTSYRTLETYNGIKREDYSGPVTLSYPEWIQYVADGRNVLEGSGGVIPGGTLSNSLLGGAVYKGKVQKRVGI